MNTQRDPASDPRQQTRLRLRKLELLAWDDLLAMTSVTWSWNDLEAGLSIATSLPANCPAGLNLLHGWGPRRWLRVRIDQSLPTGFAGADLVDGIDEGEPVVAVTGEPQSFRHAPRLGHASNSTFRLITVTHAAGLGERAQTTFLQMEPAAPHTVTTL